MKAFVSAISFLVMAGSWSASAQGEDTLTTVHSWFARSYADAPPGSDSVGSAVYFIHPRTRLARANAPQREIFGYFPYWFRARWNQLDYSLLSTIAYFSGEVAADGSVGNTHGWPRFPGDPAASADVISFINAAHSRGVRVVLCFTNFETDQVRSLVSNPDSRDRFLREALAIVQGGGGDGVNINFERIPGVSRDSLSMFMHALADSFHLRIPGSQVSCAPTDYDTRQGDWDLAALEPVVDLFFFQGYGYHYSGSSTSGPVGLLPNSPFWGGTNITTLIQYVLSRIPPGRVLLGLPHFGYRWATTGPDPKSTTSGSGVAIYYPDALSSIASYGRQWDLAGLSPWYRYQDGAGWHQGWYEDPESMSHKYQFVLDQNLMGVGIWALGQDGSNHDLWDVLGRYFGGSSDVSGTGFTGTAFRLWPNFPNPFNAMTHIRYDVGGAASIPIRLGLYDLLGREVLLLVNELRPPGAHTVRVDASSLASGVYLCRMAAAGFTQVNRVVVLK